MSLVTHQYQTTTYADVHDELRKVFARTPEEIARNANSLTGRYLQP